MTTQSAKMIVVPEGAPDELGLMVWWRLAGECDFAQLTGAWVAEGLDPKVLPTMPSPATALRRAVKGQQHRRYLARPLKGEGWALVRESAEVDELNYEVELRVHLDAVGRLQFTPSDHALVDSVRADYHHALDILSTGDLSGWLCRQAMRNLNGIPLRDTGGIYFLPPQERARWESMSNALGVASSHVLYAVPAMRTDGAIDAILSAVEAEVAASVAAVVDGIEEVGTRAARTRVAAADAAVKKLTMYEQVVGQSLHVLREQLTEAKAAAMRVMMATVDDD